MAPNATVIHEGVNLKMFRRTKKRLFKSDELVVGFAQAPTPFYRFNKLLKAAELIDFKIALAWEEYMHKQIIFSKKINYENMPLFYSSIDVFVSVPKRAGFNLAWLEAMACEVPVVGNSEGVGGELPIVHVESDDPKQIADAIEEAAQLKGKTKYRKVITERGFTWGVAAEELERSYLSGLNRNNR